MSGVYTMSRWVCLLTLAVAVVVAAAEDLKPVQTEQDEAPLQATGRTFEEWGSALMSWMGFEGYDDYDYDYDYDDYSLYYPSGSAQVGYGLPSVGYAASGSGSGGHQASSYSSYSPYQVIQHPQHFSYNARKDDYEDSSWSFGDIVMGTAALAVPAALLFSAFPASLVTLAVRRRSFDEGSEMEMELDPSELPLLNTILEARDFTALLAPHCQRKLFCEITKIGESEDASFMQRAFYYVAMLTPDRIARRVGLARTFRAARNGECEALMCGPDHLSSLTPPAVLPPSNHLPKEDSSSSSSSSSASSSSPTETKE